VENLELLKRSEQMAEKRKKKISVREVLNGRFLESEWLRRNRVLLFVIFLMLLANISVRYKSERVIREMTALEDSLKEFRSQSISIAADVMKLSRPSLIIDRVKKSGLDLESSKEPPRKLYVKKK
jgi:cell division protein FtsL